MNESMMTNAGVAAVVAVLLSLLLEWFPGLATRWDELSSSRKRGIMALAVLLISASSVGLNCYVRDVCPVDWLAWVTDALLVFIAAAAGQQGVHLLTKRPSEEVIIELTVEDGKG